MVNLSCIRMRLVVLPRLRLFQKNTFTKTFFCHRRYRSDVVNELDLGINEQASIYVHWPYCAKLCTYCNFNKYISKNVDEDKMLKCLLKETETLLHISGIKAVSSIFFGGGTPSIMNPKSAGCIIDTVSRNVYLPKDAEITIEVNPTTIEKSKLQTFRSCGVNRVSIGVQALDNKDLAFLGREHKASDAVSCVQEAKELFPGKVSVDVMFGRPGQSLDSWIKELQQILTFCDNHLSLYQLTVERGTKLHLWVKQEKVVMPDSDLMADLYKTTVEILEENGYSQYEVSNFAKQGAECQHNLNLWKGMQYIGIGPGAHGRFVPIGLNKTQREARIQTLDPRSWMLEVEKFGHGTRKSHTQTKYEQLEELILVGMRTTEGINTALWDRHCDVQSLLSVFKDSSDVQYLADENLLQIDEKGIRATKNGLMLLDSLVPYLVDALADKLKVQMSKCESHRS